ncbi:RNA polymerase sigma factor [Martelella endophytica]|uniref:RNA polymerase sigma factor n=1 Tax=Martelella endophytica TaxID=1486262 RepID=A0A0D5LY31_MAREN|nr:RNA polymerase sigma factor [Martelella endophytica]
MVDLIPALRAFARTFCRNPNDADDLVQETMLKGIANLDKFKPGTRLKSWLFTIMRNTFYTQIKARNREAPGAEDCVAGLPQHDATQDWSMRGQELMDALSRIPPHYREMFILVMVLGESYIDAAEICGCAIGTVKSRINRARQLLLEELGETQ